jgi:putative transposase
VHDVAEPTIETKSGKIAGFDFGLKTFLTVSDATRIESPEFFKAGLRSIQVTSKKLSRKV